MNTVIDLFSSPWAQALGWTLLHSLWQSLVCVIMAIALLRFIPSRFSAQRYAIATAALLLTFVTSCGTFLYLNSGGQSPFNATNILVQQTVPARHVLSDVGSFTSVLEYVRVYIQSNIPFIVILWGAGAILFSLRVCGGWWYTKKLRSNSFPVEGELSSDLQRLAAKLNIQRFIALAESSIIHAPVVIGYIRPIILLPVGMSSGFTTEQLESILIHELVHIRRGDYLMNLIQSFLEALFFFNPFVWMISGIMRREREHCCDDAVVRVHGNALAYARALATLEEARLSKSGLALSLAENKNQLLNRIKRIMEKSVQHYSGRERMVPLILLVVGLICASWLTVRSDNRDMLPGSERNDEQLAASDTSVRSKSSSYYRSEVTTINEDGEPEVQVIEQIDGDFEPNAFSMHFNVDAPEPLDPPDFDFNFSMPSPPDIAGMEVEIPEMPEPEMWIHIDTFPHEMNWNNSHDWEEFSKAFEENFKSQFSEFYEKHEKELKKMMEHVEKQVSQNGNDQQLMGKITAMVDQQEKLAKIQELKHLKDFAEGQQLQALKAEEMARRFEERNALQFEKMEKEVRKMEEKVKAMEKHHKEMEEALQEELVKDGYLGTNENVNNVDINNDRIEINGKKIKTSDDLKYRKLIKKFEEPVEFNDNDGRKE